MCLCGMSVPSQAQELRKENAVLHYTPVSYKAMVALMWKYKVHDISDPNIMDDYLRIVNCPLYQKYGSDDFVWERIREGVRRDLSYFSSSIPDRFEIYAFMPIDKYDFKKNAFIIPEEFALDNAGAIQIPFFDDSEFFNGCIGSDQQIKLFPRDIKFIADNKFSLLEIPVAPDKADEVLNNIQKYEYKNAKDQRILAVRFRIKINTIDAYEVTFSSSQLRFKGELDEIAFFEDPERTKLVWKKQFKLLD